MSCTAVTIAATTGKPILETRFMHNQKKHLPSFSVIKGVCLGYNVYRGFAPLSEIAKLSKADIFDQSQNPVGTQRNLNRQHARKAHEYVANTEKAFYPEIILNIRDSSFVRFESKASSGLTACGQLKFVKDTAKASAIVVSRLDRKSVV